MILDVIYLCQNLAYSCTATCTSTLSSSTPSPTSKLCSSFQTSAFFWMLRAFFWVIPRRLNFVCRRFGTLCLLHLNRRIGIILIIPIRLWRWNRQSVPKRRHIKFRCRWITQNKTCNKQRVVFVNSEISPSCLQSRCPKSKLIPFHTFWTPKISAELIVHSVTVWNAYCWILWRRFSGSVVCFRYLRGSVWSGSEWYDLAYGSFSVLSLCWWNKWKHSAVAATVYARYSGRLSTTFIVHSFS